MNPIRRGQQFAEQLADSAQHADQVILASYSKDDFPNVLAAGLATCSFEEYQQRLAGMIATLEQRGTRVVTIPATARQLLDTLASHRLPNTPDGRAKAIGLIFAEKPT